MADANLAVACIYLALQLSGACKTSKERCYKIEIMDLKNFRNCGV